jgi:hypothetical protein
MSGQPLKIAGNGNGAQDGYNANHHHQFYQCETRIFAHGFNFPLLVKMV